jgi:hypothetical protein
MPLAPPPGHGKNVEQRGHGRRGYLVEEASGAGGLVGGGDIVEGVDDVVVGVDHDRRPPAEVYVLLPPAFARVGQLRKATL